MNSIVRDSSCNPLIILIIFVQIIEILVQINEFNHISFFELRSSLIYVLQSFFLFLNNTIKIEA